jgi:hypothetical protein
LKYVLKGAEQNSLTLQCVSIVSITLGKTHIGTSQVSFGKDHAGAGYCFLKKQTLEAGTYSEGTRNEDRAEETHIAEAGDYFDERSRAGKTHIGGSQRSFWKRPYRRHGDLFWISGRWKLGHVKIVLLFGLGGKAGAHSTIVC